jgi:hypothetical protein
VGSGPQNLANWAVAWLSTRFFGTNAPMLNNVMGIQLMFEAAKINHFFSPVV